VRRQAIPILPLEKLECKQMSSRLQKELLWSKEELSDRASGWARRRGWPMVTVASFLKWKQEGLLPRPVVKSLGRGHGSSSGWPTGTYRQLLQLLHFRHRGLRRWRDLRIALWLDGYDIDRGLIRGDLKAFYLQIVKSFNRELRTDMWGATGGPAPSQTARRVISREITGPDVLESAIERFELDPLMEPLVRIGLSALMTTEGQRLAIAFVHQFFGDGPGDIPSAMEAFRTTLPMGFGSFLEGVEKDLVRHAGILADPDGFNNPLLVGLHEATDTTLLNIRDAANESSRIWKSGFKVAALFSRLRPDLLGPFRLMAPLLARVADSMGTRVPFQSPEARVVIMALALASSSVRANEGVKLTVGVRGMAALCEWLTLHPELIEELETSDAKWNAMAEDPDFPIELKRLLEAGVNPASQQISASSADTG